MRYGGATVAEETVLAEIPAHTLQVVSYDGQIANPHLWDGIEDPYRYVVKAELAAPDKVDEQSVRIGFRYFSINAQQGFLLNGRPYPLRGVALHQDYPGAMSAMDARTIPCRLRGHCRAGLQLCAPCPLSTRCLCV